MANWTLFFSDQAAQGTKAFSGFTNGLNATNGGGAMIAQISSTSATITWTFAAGKQIGAIGIFNHSLDGATISLHYRNGGPYVLLGSDTVDGYGDQIFHFSTTPGSRTDWRLTIAGANGKQIGAVGLLPVQTGVYIAFATTDPSYPLGITYDAAITTQDSAAGYPKEQKHGGAWRVLDLEVRYVPVTGATDEGLLDNTFLDAGGQYGTSGWLGPVWLWDDAGEAYYGVIQRPVDMSITGPGPRATVRLRFREIPHTGVAS